MRFQNQLGQEEIGELSEKRWSKNPTPHVVHKSCGNGNRITYPSIKVEERKCSAKNAHFLSFSYIYLTIRKKYALFLRPLET